MHDRVEPRLRRLIDDALKSSGREPLEQDIGPQELLLGLLDSLTLATLIVLIEEEWDFAIEDEEVAPELFESIGALTRFVESRAAGV